jgi:starch synthase
MNAKLKVLFLSAEAVPFAKVGGLAEFAGALPKALHKMGVDVRLMIPRYNDPDHTRATGLKRVGHSLPVPAGPHTEPAHLFETEVQGVPVYLIYNDQHFGNRERVYGFNDDPQRFLFFSRAVIAAMASLDWKPDLVHANDWHTAPVPTWLDVYGKTRTDYRDIATLFTIHNFAYQGICGRLLLSFGQMNDVPHLPVEPPGKVNWMAQGIAHADLVSTVSSAYAQEILTSDVGGDLQPLLHERRDRVFGILSGIDTELWDPSDDGALPQTYDETSLNMRSVNKTALQRELRMPADMDIPMLGLVTRLDPLKGLDLLPPVLEDLLERRDIQFVLLGTGDESLVAPLQELQQRYPRSIRVLVRFDERMARKIYGSSDIFVMPSRHESVSVGVMTAMHYGAIPVVRATGGLSETVVDADDRPDRGTGFCFDAFTAPALLDVLQRALDAYDDEARWVALQRSVMDRDFSWQASARAYVDLYERAHSLHAMRR